jgi:phage terminase Nu1 subunit (DNA packaging protein)
MDTKESRQIDDVVVGVPVEAAPKWSGVARQAIDRMKRAIARAARGVAPPSESEDDGSDDEITQKVFIHPGPNGEANAGKALSTKGA